MLQHRLSYAWGQGVQNGMGDKDGDDLTGLARQAAKMHCTGSKLLYLATPGELSHERLTFWHWRRQTFLGQYQFSSPSTASSVYTDSQAIILPFNYR